MKFPLFPEQASSGAAEVDALYFFLLGLSLFFLALIFGPMLVFLFRYRKGQSVDRSPLAMRTLPIEATWTAVPFVLAIGIFLWGARIYFDQRRPPDGALEVNAIGKQWMWKIQHEEGPREINELHVPVGQNVKVTLASQDVIHSFYIPAFRVKQDAVPGRYTTLWFRATQPGTHHLFCAEYCGSDHSQMRGWVKVLEPADYQAWLREQGTGESLADRGRRRFQEHGCAGCHSVNSTVRAPLLEGLYGRPVPLRDGRVVVADAQYLRDSILLPERDVVAGYDPVMPTFQGKIDEAELLEIIAHIRRLGTEPAQGAQP